MCYWVRMVVAATEWKTPTRWKNQRKFVISIRLKCIIKIRESYASMVHSSQQKCQIQSQFLLRNNRRIEKNEEHGRSKSDESKKKAVRYIHHIEYMGSSVISIACSPYNERFSFFSQLASFLVRPHRFRKSFMRSFYFQWPDPNAIFIPNTIFPHSSYFYVGSLWRLADDEPSPSY